MRFKVIKDLDKHIAEAHPKPNKPVSFDCEQCNSKFGALFQLRLHIEKKHKQLTEYSCNYCGEIFTNNERANEHMGGCHMGFEKANVKDRFFFRNGHCLKGDLCTFAHNSSKSRRGTQKCRNGPYCRYLAGGVCSFFHPGIGVQNPKPEINDANDEGQERAWCRYFKDCSQVPNCPDLHSKEDFPKLPKNNQPPIGAKRMANAWMEY